MFLTVSLTLMFLALKMQNLTFLRKNGFWNSFFIKLTFRWLQTGLSNLKNTKQLKFCIAYGIFFRIFKNDAFLKKNRDFEIHH